MTNGNRAAKGPLYRYKTLKLFSFGLLIFVIYLVFDYFGPSRIPLKQDSVFGFECLRAKDLLVQEYDNHGNLWATRGMIVYILPEGEDSFERVTHIPTGLNLFWLRNFTIVRRLTVRPECVELTVTDRGDLCVISAGHTYVRYNHSKDFIKTMEMRYYGFGDQGVRNAGFLSVGDSTAYFGEYFRNSTRDEVSVYTTTDNLSGWRPVYTFRPGEIRHIHAVQYDPFTESVWVCTGDSNEESMIATLSGSFEQKVVIGGGSQQWRVCQLVFTSDKVFWGTDNGTEDLSGIFMWNREDQSLNKLSGVDGAVFYGTQLENGLIVMSTDREGMENELDDKTRLFILDNEQVTSVECGTWKHHKPGFWFKFAKLRFQRNQGSRFLAISVLNQEEVRDSDLILIHQDELNAVVSKDF